MKFKIHLIFITFLIYGNLSAQFSWSTIQIGGTVTNLEIADNNQIFVSANNSNLFKSNDNGATWQAVENNWTNSINSIDISKSGTIFIGLKFSKGAFKSTDNGTSWIKINPDLNVESVIEDSEGNLFIGASNNKGVFRSTDNGNNWETVNNGFQSVSSIWSVAVDKDDLLYAACNDGIYFSPDSGNSWTKGYNTPVGKPEKLLADSSGRIWAAYNQHGAFCSYNNGANWVNKNSGLTNTELKDLSVAPDGTIYAAAGDGIYQLLPLTNQWIKISESSFNEAVISIDVADNNTIYGGCNGKIIKGTKNPTGVNDYSELVLTDFRLEQNYPNPFNPSTTINFTVPVGDENFRPLLKVYDTLGNEITTLITEYNSSGNYEVKFNAENLSSGIYFYTLTAGKYSETKKMILMK